MELGALLEDDAAEFAGWLVGLGVLVWQGLLLMGFLSGDLAVPFCKLLYT